MANCVNNSFTLSLPYETIEEYFVAYIGQKMTDGDRFDVFSNVVEFVWMPSFFQPCGHILIKIGVLNQGVSKNLYFHIPGPDMSRGRNSHYGFEDRPYFMDEVGFNRYLREKKT